MIMSKSYGPTLPPGFKKQESDSEDDDVLGPALPPDYHKSSTSIMTNKSFNDSEKHKQSTSRTHDGQNRANIGPQIPHHLLCNANKTYEIEHDGSNNEENNDDESEIFGPLPPPSGMQSQESSDADMGFWSSTVNNSSNIKEKEEEKIKRDEWMTVVPKALKRTLGMKDQKSFSTKSSSSKSEKKGEAVDKQRDEDMQKFLEEYNQTHERHSSLLEMHLDKRKKAKLDSKPLERKAFDPETDLQQRRCTSKQAQSIIEKAQLLNTRFSKGSNKFL